MPLHPSTSLDSTLSAPSQYTRMHVLDGFRSGAHHVLVATDVAARGLDIKTLRTVVNYDAAKDIDTHVHRCGLYV